MGTTVKAVRRPLLRQYRLTAVLRRLRSAKAQLRKLGVRHVAVFGALARGEAHCRSDIDVLIDLDPNRRLDIFDYAGLAAEIADLLPGPVDIARRDRLKPELRERIEQEAVAAF